MAGAKDETAPSPTLGSWAMFLGGYWTRTRPNEPGEYPVRALDGTEAGSRVLVSRALPSGERVTAEAGVGHGEPGWLGFWWCRPRPPMPAHARVEDA